MSRTRNNVIGILAAVLVATAVAPAASVARGAPPPPSTRSANWATAPRRNSARPSASLATTALRQPMPVPHARQPSSRSKSHRRPSRPA